MKAFAHLFALLDATTSSNAKLAAMEAYFAQAPQADAAWAVYFLAGGKPRQLVPSRVLRDFIQQAAGVPPWLFEESYHAVGDLAETLSLLMPEGDGTDSMGLADWMQTRLLPLRGAAPEDIHDRLAIYFAELDQAERFVCAKLLTGSLRVGVSRLLVTRALARVAQVDAKIVAQRMMGYTDTRARPDGAAFAQLVAAYSDADRQRGDGQPYPFCLAHPWSLPLADMDARLGPPDQWQIEWKWDGIRAQVVRRAGRVFIWSRGEELVTEQFPEISRMAQGLGEGVVLDGEIVVWEDDTVQPFARLQQRLGRKIVGPKVLADQPVVFLAYDLLEQAGQDCRALSQQARRERLVQVCSGVTDPVLRLSPVLTGATWAELAAQREQSRTLGVEGMMLKSVSAAYGVGRTKNDGVWWKWKVDPLSIDAVLIYAQRGHGRRASLYTDYTFALWDGPPEMKDRRLVPVAKAYSGLTDEEIRQVDAIIRRTTVEKFGPVRSVKPALVFELGFEGIARSSRHKSGVALRFPRMLRWRQDKPIDQADSVDGLAVWLPA